MAQKMNSLLISAGEPTGFMIRHTNAHGEKPSTAARLFASKYTSDICQSQDRYDRVILGFDDEWEYCLTEADEFKLGEYAQDPVLRCFIVELALIPNSIATKALLFKPTKIKEQFLEDDVLITPLFDIYDFVCSYYDDVVRIGLLGVDQNGRGIVNMLAVNSRINTKRGQAMMDALFAGQRESYSERNTLYAASFLVVNKLLRDYPEFLSSRKETIEIAKQESRKGKSKKKSAKRNLVKVRTIYELKEGAVISEETGKIEYTCPCWTVRGHWRHLKDGRKVWVRPYRKGKDRLCDDALVAKDYIV